MRAVISFWLDNLDARTKIEPESAPLSEDFVGHLVTESVVQPYEQNWKDGQRRAGITLFTALEKPTPSRMRSFITGGGFDIPNRRSGCIPGDGLIFATPWRDH